MKERVNRLAVGLNEMGFVKGDRLGVWMPTNSEWVFNNNDINIISINNDYFR